MRNTPKGLGTRSITDQIRRCRGMVDGLQCDNDAMPGRALCEDCVERERASRNGVKVSRRAGTPEHFLEMVERVLNDPDITSHRENIAMLDAFIQAEQEGLQAPTKVLEKALKLYKSGVGKGAEAAEDLIKLGTLLKTARLEAARRDSIVRLMNEQRKHIEAENRKEAMASAVVSAKEFMSFIDFMISLDRDTIPDEVIRDQRIAAMSARYQVRVDEAPYALPVTPHADADIQDADFTIEE